jgi:hypothetical protein
MKEFKTTIVTAEYLLGDDKFKMGGQMHRVLDAKTHFMTEMTIEIHNFDRPDLPHIILTVPKSTIFRIYNQK